MGGVSKGQESSSGDAKSGPPRSILPWFDHDICYVSFQLLDAQRLLWKMGRLGLVTSMDGTVRLAWWILSYRTLYINTLIKTHGLVVSYSGEYFGAG